MIGVDIIFILIGGLMLLVGLYSLMRTINFVRKAQQVKGTVIRMVGKHKRGSGSGARIDYYAVYKFTTLDGQTIEKEDSVSSDPPRFQEGQMIDVLYQPNKPQNSHIKHGIHLYLAPIGLIGVGFIFVVVGVVLVTYHLS